MSIHAGCYRHRTSTRTSLTTVRLYASVQYILHNTRLVTDRRRRYLDNRRPSTNAMMATSTI